VGRHFPFNLYEGWKSSVDETLLFLSAKPEIKNYLVSNAYDSDFLENLKTFSNNTKYYLENFKNNFFGATPSDFSDFKTLLTNNIRVLLLESEFLPLVDLLYKCFIKTCNWKNEKSLKRFNKFDPGLYILFNNKSFVSYIGQTNNLERRFLEHKTALMEGTHFNKNLRRSVGLANIEDLSLFVIDYGYDYLNVENRQKREIEIINNWPSNIYNIKDVNHLYRKKFDKKNC
jgi:hypothetical protein